MVWPSLLRGKLDLAQVTNLKWMPGPWFLFQVLLIRGARPAGVENAYRFVKLWPGKARARRVLTHHELAVRECVVVVLGVF